MARRCSRSRVTPSAPAGAPGRPTAVRRTTASPLTNCGRNGWRSRPVFGMRRVADIPRSVLPVDWDLGRYEYVAAQLQPAAEVAVDRLAPRPGERVLDLGCGTGNASLLLAGRGARTFAVDPSPRLLDVARQESSARGLDVDFTSGQAATLPFPDASIDAIVSVFGLIFAPDASAAASEMARVLVPSGRIVLSAWLPGGALSAQATLRREALAAALGETRGAAPFPWHDRQALSALLAPYGFSVETREEVLAFTAASAREYAEGEWQNHPLWVEAHAVLEPLGTWQTVCEATMRVLSDANEEPSSFRISSRYVVAGASRGAPGHRESTTGHDSVSTG